MATKAIGAGARRTAPAGKWRLVLRRSARRALEIGAALLLFGAALFLVLSLASYRQTDPSPSTAAGGEVLNWMGLPGAFVADATLFLFGPTAVLLVPLLIAWGRRLWRFAEAEESGEELSELARGGRHWWRSVVVLLLAMALIGTVLSLTFTAPGGTLPATMGGLAGLLGAKGIRALAAFLPELARG